MYLVTYVIITLSLRVIWLGNMHKETNLQPVNIAIFVKSLGSLTCFLGLGTSARQQFASGSGSLKIMVMTTAFK